MIPRPVAEAQTGAVLVVDGDTAARGHLAGALEGAGHTVAEAGDVASALERMSVSFPDVVLTDVRLPGATGVELLVETRSRAPETRVIVCTSPADLQQAVAAVAHGIDHLLLKPVEPDELRARVADSIARRRAVRARERERELLEARLRQRETESKIWVLRAAHALAHAVEAKDPFTAGHARRVTAYAMTMAEVTGRIDVLSFRLAGDLHDVGKIGVPDRILGKPGGLTRREFDQVRRHPATGARILAPLIDDPLVLDVVRCHHERWDGSGYPEGLRGEAIPFPARVLAVADSLDAMTSPRAYRAALSWSEAVALVRDGAGTLFDPEVVAAFESALPLLEQHFLRFRAEADALAGAAARP